MTNRQEHQAPEEFMRQVDNITKTDWRDGALEEYERDMKGMQNQLVVSRKLNADLLETLVMIEAALDGVVDDYAEEMMKVRAAIARAKAA
jgi:hypothetical protein